MIQNGEIEHFALREGADLVGMVSVENLMKPHPWRPPQGVMPEARSVILFALKHSDGSLESPIMRNTLMDMITIYHELCRIGYRLTRFLEKNGFRGVWIHPAYPVEWSLETRGLVGDFSLRHAAVSAGMGFIGRNNLLVTPQFGPRVRLGAVLTNAGLESSAKKMERNCGDCRVCIDQCPGKAISPDGVDLRRCSPFVAGPASLGSMIKFFTELLDQPKEEAKKMIKSPQFLNFHQALQIGSSVDCITCMSSCPLGKGKV